MAGVQSHLRCLLWRQGDRLAQQFRGDLQFADVVKESRFHNETLVGV